MTGQRGIERTLDAWFVDGPSVMPDRLFDAVLDQVGHTRQSPLAHLRLRLTEMNPKIRLFTVVAAALLVVVAALAAIGGGAKDLVHATQSAPPAAAPSAAADVPPELAFTWMGSSKPLTGLDPGAGVTLVFDDRDLLWMTQSASTDEIRLKSTVVSIDDSTFEVANATATRECDPGASGSYSWSLSATGKILTIAAAGDTCAERLASVPGTYWKMECPTDEDNCLGPLDAGTYSSQFLDPFVGPDNIWRPRFDALRYTVPDGWINVDDWPGFFTLRPDGAGEDTKIGVATDVVLSDQSNRCSELPDQRLGTTASDIATAISTASGMVATSPQPVNIGGLAGFVLDISLDPGWTKTCPWTGGKPARILLADRSTSEGFAWALVGDQAARLYLLDIGDDRAMMIEVTSATSSAFEAFAEDAIPIVESFVFNH